MSGWFRISPEGLTGAGRSPSNVAHSRALKLAGDLSSSHGTLSTELIEVWLPSRVSELRD